MTTASFRDPAGNVFLHQERVYRVINETGIADFEKALSSASLHRVLDSGRLVGASILSNGDASAFRNAVGNLFVDNDQDAGLVAEHNKVPFQNYPYEWSPEMLHAAAQLTLELQQDLLSEGLGVKDATPYNILFQGHKPVFVDWLSFETRDPFDPVWLPQAQFVRTFILPLLVNKYFGIPLAQIFLGSRDGIEPEQVYEMCSVTRKVSSPFLTLVTLPNLLGRKSKQDPSLYKKHLLDDPEKATFILERQLKYLGKLLSKVRPDPQRTSEWAEYVGPNQHFTDEYLKTKHDFATDALSKYHPRTVLDIGCNTGYFSRLAANSGASVVAVDLDQTSAGKVWQMAVKEDLDILPLVIDMARPTPATGWLNGEFPSFLHRVTGKMDCVMMFAVIHHMLVTERIPLGQIIRLASELTTSTVIIEFVPPHDPMFKQIARGNDALYDYLTKDMFETVCTRYFTIESSKKLADSDRWLYLLKK